MTGAEDHRKGRDPSPFDQAVDGAEAGDQTTQVFVSLYLILLAFFMVMNSISNQEVARAGVVLESVNQRFKRPFPPVARLDLLARERIDAHNAEFYEEVRAIFAGLLGFPGKFTAPGGDVMQAEFPAEVLFPLNEVEVRADQTRFLSALADLLTRAGTGERRQVEFVLTAPDAVLQDERPWQNRDLRRAATLARELEDRGVPAQAIASGLAIGKSAMIKLRFISEQLGPGDETPGHGTAP